MGVPDSGVVEVSASGDGLVDAGDDLFGAGEAVDLYGDHFDATDMAAEFGPDAFIDTDVPVGDAPAPRALAVGPAGDVVIAGMGGLGISRGAAAAVLDTLEAKMASGELPDMRDEIPESLSLAEAQALLAFALSPTDVAVALAPYALVGRVPMTALIDTLERRLEQLGTASLTRNLAAVAEAAWQERTANWLDGRSDDDATAELLTAACDDTEIRAWLYGAIADRLEAGTLDRASAINKLEKLKDVVAADIRANRRGPLPGPLEDAFARLAGVIDSVLDWDESLAREMELEPWGDLDDQDAAGAREAEADPDDDDSLA